MERRCSSPHSQQHANADGVLIVLTSLAPIVLVSSHLLLGLPNDLFSNGFSIRLMFEFQVALRATCPTHPTLFWCSVFFSPLLLLLPELEATGKVAVLCTLMCTV
jgi:lipid-A-disaccharide synthase-like uncharacterized protein